VATLPEPLSLPEPSFIFRPFSEYSLTIHPPTLLRAIRPLSPEILGMVVKFVAEDSALEKNERGD
jgi:hypothetical protein